MRRILFVISCFGFLISTAHAADVLIIAGQSNAGGKAVWADLAKRHAHMSNCPPNVRLVEWESEISYDGRAQWGVEVPIAHQFYAHNPHRELLIVKCWRGGTNIWQWIPPRSDYVRMISCVQAALSATVVQRIGFVWIQGEDDTWMDKDLAVNYLRDLKLLIDSIRSDLGYPAMPVAVVVLSAPFRQPAPWVYLVSQAQIDISSVLPDVASVCSIGCSKSHDMIHYDTAGIIMLGRRLYAYLKGE